MKTRIALIVTFLVILVIPASLFGLLQIPDIRTLNEPTAALQRKIDSGEVKLDYEENRGYLMSVLRHLNVPLSSQTLAFAKSSFQIHLISPSQPRAVYFNDDVYVGYAQGGDMVEVASVDPNLGPVFYALDQKKTDHPKFQVQAATQCVVCHDSSISADPIPRLLILSVLPDPAGTALQRSSLLTNDKSPFRERWGGWYVTGTHGNQRHLGNTLVRTPAQAIGEMKTFIKGMNLDSGANVTDLSRYFDTKPYPTAHSDIVALMILGHQTHVHNLMTLASYKVKNPEVTSTSVDELAEQLLRTLLFVEAAPLTEPVRGTTSYASDFLTLGPGPRDKRGRSLRELDLKTRLLRYPLSYLIYSKQFDAMPAQIKQHIYRRLRQILNGEDQSEDFAHLTESDRRALFEILTETKPDFSLQ